MKSEVEQLVNNSLEVLITPKINELTPKTDNLSSSAAITVPQKTYAAVASTSAAFVIKPTSKQSVVTTKSDMLQNINPVSSNIHLSQVINAEEGGLVISCGKADSTKFIELASTKLSDKYIVKELTAVHPRVRVVGISEGLEPDAIMNFLKLQNKDVITTVSECQIIYVTRLKKRRTAKSTYFNIIEKGKLFVGYDFCCVFDATEMRRCFKCNGFNHLSSNCTIQNEICPRCSLSHKLSECTSQDLCCSNCLNYNKSNKHSTVDVKHAAWDRNCTVFKNDLMKFKNNVLGIK